MSALKFPKMLPALCVVIIAVALGQAPEAAAAPDPNTLLTNPLNRHNMAARASGGHGGIKSALTGGTDQICIFCHTPHAAEPVDGPLWNRRDPAGPFPLYGGALLAIRDQLPGSAGIQAAAQYGTGTYPNGSSRLCMSCHDGVTAIGVGLLRDGSDIAMVGSVGHELDPDGSLLDTLGTVIDLATSHPISFIYNDAIAQSIDAVYSAMSPPGPHYKGPVTYNGGFNPAVNSPLDSQSRMQCTTCHDPHYDTKLSNVALPPFWQNPSSASPYADMCAQCHIGGIPTGPIGDHFPGPGI